MLAEQPGRISEGSRSKAEHAIKAIETGTPRVHVLDGRVFDGLLNEIFSNEGVGSLVYGNDYQQIRRARKSDVRMIYNLTRAAVRREELIHRTQQAIEKNIDQFYVFEIDENIIACVTLYFYPDKPQMAEVGSLYVMPFYHNRGIGKKMVEYAMRAAKERGATTVTGEATRATNGPIWGMPSAVVETPITGMPARSAMGITANPCWESDGPRIATGLALIRRRKATVAPASSLPVSSSCSSSPGACLANCWRAKSSPVRASCPRSPALPVRAMPAPSRN